MNRDQYLAMLVKAFADMHGCQARHLETVPVIERFEGKVVWDGDVSVFALTGHPTATKGYGWGCFRDRKIVDATAVLELPPVASPLTAVRAAIVSSSLEAQQPVPTIRAWQAELAEAMRLNKLEVAKMTHAELLAQARRNASGIYGDPKRLVSLYRVHAKPLPGTEWADEVERYEGYFCCFADRADPQQLLSEALNEQAEASVVEMKLVETGTIEAMLHTRDSRRNLERTECLWLVGKTIKFS